MSKTVLISGASSGFGADAARDLAAGGHTVYAGMRDLTGRNARAAEAARQHAQQESVDLRPIELEVSEQASVDACVAQVLEQSSRLDVLVHNAGHMVVGPLEAFTPSSWQSSTTSTWSPPNG